METMRKVVLCDGPTCMEWTMAPENSEPLSPGWSATLDDKTHFHSKQCEVFYSLCQLYGSIEDSKSMKPADFLRRVGDLIDSQKPPEIVRKVTTRTSRNKLQVETKPGQETPSIRAVLLAILQTYPGPHSIEEIIGLASSHGYDYTSTQVSPALSAATLREKYPQLIVTTQEREGQRNRNLYSWSNQ